MRAVCGCAGESRATGARLQQGTGSLPFDPASPPASSGPQPAAQRLCLKALGHMESAKLLTACLGGSFASKFLRCVASGARAGAGVGGQDHGALPVRARDLRPLRQPRRQHAPGLQVRGQLHAAMRFIARWSLSLATSLPPIRSHGM